MSHTTTVASIKTRDDYKALPIGAGSLGEAVDSAMLTISAAFAKNVSDGTKYQDNISGLLREMVDQQVVS